MILKASEIEIGTVFSISGSHRGEQFKLTGDAKEDKNAFQFGETKLSENIIGRGTNYHCTGTGKYLSCTPKLGGVFQNKIVMWVNENSLIEVD